jgi:hypothetical protein
MLVVVGDLNIVAKHAEKLRLAVTTDDCAVVLDHLSISITVDQTEEIINSLFPTGLLSLCSDSLIEKEESLNSSFGLIRALFFLAVR